MYNNQKTFFGHLLWQGIARPRLRGQISIYIITNIYYSVTDCLIFFFIFRSFSIPFILLVLFSFILFIILIIFKETRLVWNFSFILGAKQFLESLTVKYFTRQFEISSTTPQTWKWYCLYNCLFDVIKLEIAPTSDLLLVFFDRYEQDMVKIEKCFLKLFLKGLILEINFKIHR